MDKFTRTKEECTTEYKITEITLKSGKNYTVKAITHWGCAFQDKTEAQKFINRLKAEK